MAFKSKAENNGQIDENINTKGRIKSKERTRRSIRDQELLSLLRKVRPHVAKSVVVAAGVMQNEEAKDSDKLKAAVILLNEYRVLVNTLYNGEDNEEDGKDVEPQPQAPVFSLTVIGDKD